MARAGKRLYPLATLLLNEGQAPSRAAIASALGTHRAAIQSTLDHLEYHRAIRHEQGRVVVDRDRLLYVLTAHRIAGQRPSPPFATHLRVEDAAKRLQDAGIPHAFCMFSAANLLAFFEERREVQLYVHPGDRSRARATLESQGDRSVRLFAENVEALEPGWYADVRVTSPTLTVADLRAHPEGGAHAAFLLEKRVKPHWGRVTRFHG